jgi:hypothetical protein
LTNVKNKTAVLYPFGIVKPAPAARTKRMLVLSEWEPTFTLFDVDGTVIAVSKDEECLYALRAELEAVRERRESHEHRADDVRNLWVRFRSTGGRQAAAAWAAVCRVLAPKVRRRRYDPRTHVHRPARTAAAS